MTTRLPDGEYDARLERVRDRLARTACGAAVVFDATNVAYLTGFHHVATERPVALAVTADRVAVTVPRLEVERVTDNPRIDTVHDYFDYPGGMPMATVASMLRHLDVDRVYADADGAPGVMGYSGPPLSSYVEVTVQDWVSRMRWSKSDAEVALLRESARWANLGHRRLADALVPGAHPATVGQRASTAASRAMLDTLGERYVPRVRGDGPVSVGLVSDGETALPHGHTPNRRLREGSVVVTGATANVDGYGAELERTMFVGDPTDEDVHYFEVMCEAGRVAVDALAPGVPVADVDQAVWDYFLEQGVTDLARHHTGHGLGLAPHEPPYLDRGWGDADEDPGNHVVEPGHVYAVEPGLYTERAGYRHSDTVAVTEDGVERLTYFPRSLGENVVR
ncbi:M24 family metallopeptidase [Halomarina ordinaria]|uniref:M24 family metallopeptidase n=1 Tax=Halomarina ordinaria TaxID=3033939 RepID=A0ABD5U775_9EURY|nr:Xaa-Pro peptidase family protein [Halomarina sp. PSRA2]